MHSTQHSPNIIRPLTSRFPVLVLIGLAIAVTMITSSAIRLPSAFAESNTIVNPKQGPLKGGSNADDPAIWIHPSDPNKSLLFLSDKDAGIYVFDFNGTQLQHIDFGTSLNNIDVRKGFIYGTETIDIVAANLRAAGKLAVLRINPDHTGADAVSVLADASSSGNDIQEDSYGFTLYRRPSDGALFAFDKPKGSTSVKQFHITETGGQILVTQVREINDVSIGVAEGFVADDQLGFVYFAEESKGIHKYNADPNSGELGRLSFFAQEDGISGDREGLGLYACNNGEGYLVLSSQGNSTFKVYERLGSNSFVKTFSAIDAEGTDGLDVSSSSAPGFPDGFAVIHDDPGAQYYLYDWGDIAGPDLRICPDGGSVIPTPTPSVAPPTPTASSSPPSTEDPPPDFTIAFIGDQGMTSNSVAVLELIKAEGAEMVLHQGDLAYSSDVNGWDKMITDILGASFPYFASVGNHDEGEWNQYQQKLTQRLNLIPEAQCVGEYGIKTFCVYKGFAFVLSGAGTMGSGHVDFINQSFANDQHLWRICSWHKNMNKMQVGGKGDETGWGVYEACREAGAIVATGHEHSYSRTYLMSSFENQVIANQSSTLELQRGASFAFVSGLGGKSIRNQDQDWPWMAAIYTSDQDADYGALFCTFNESGQADRASCYFKDINGKIADQFELASNLGSEGGSFVDVPTDHWAFDSIEALYQAGYVAGCSTSPPMYCPDQTMTRAESAVFVERGVWGAGYIPSQPILQVFTDVPLGEWFAKWANGLWEDGYTAGCGTSPLAYCPLQQHSMAEGAVFFLRILNGPDFEPPAAQGIFTDVPVNAWYARWVEAAYQAGLYSPCQTDPDLQACPDHPLTRAMGAFMMTQAKGITPP